MAELFAVNRTGGRRAGDTQPSAIRTATVVRIVLVVLAVLGGVWIAGQLATVLLLLVFSVLFAYLVAPLVTFLRRRLAVGRRRHLPTGVAIGVAYLVIMSAIGLAIAWLVPHVTEQVTKLAENAPDRMNFADAAGQSLRTLQSRLRIPGLSPSMVEHATTSAMSVLDSAARAVAGALVRAATFVPWLILVPILAFFLLKDAEKFRQGAIGLMPEYLRTDAAELIDRVNAALAAFVRAQLVSCLVIGTIIGVGFAALGVPSALLFGIGAGIAEFVPLVGPLVVAAVSAVVAATRVNPMLAVWVLLFLGVLRIAQDYVIYPRLVGRNIHLHPLAVIVAVLCGAELGGVAGVLLSVPVLAIIAATYRYYAESGNRVIG